MATYKVPQDVESEDKLIGPFGFRQFIYLIIVAFACFVAYVLSTIFIGLIIIPLPFIIFFFAIAMPLRKDQPTEVYLAALIQYHLKPKVRMWQPDGVNSTVEITVPKTIEESRTKDLTEEEALQRLGHLAQIMDTRGWAARGVFNPNIDSMASTKMSEEAVAEAEQPDMLDSSGLSAQAFNSLLDQQKTQQLQAARDGMIRATQAAQYAPELAQNRPTPIEVGAVPAEETPEDRAALANIRFNPYPEAIRQQVIQPIGAEPTIATPLPPQIIQTAPQQTTSELPSSAGIIELVESPFSIETIANQAARQNEEASKMQEVDIKLH